MKLKFNIRETLKKYKRVLILARKPNKDELKKTSKICALGFLIIGMLGFIFYMLSVLFGG